MQIVNSIIINLLTILKTQPFSCGAFYVELQSLLNFLLYIAKLFKVDFCNKLVKLITEIQTILVQYGSGCLGGGEAAGATGHLKVFKVRLLSRHYWTSRCCRRAHHSL
ncbi:collagen-like repeat preface domain-containing protein [Bacillus cereus]|uniref:collagen-like repeat preface domain-containing protein n=1 Tax=Bacillus cereus TaxID=1396 RepID=UPI0039B517AE